jgi:hypothetical protein
VQKGWAANANFKQGNKLLYYIHPLSINGPIIFNKLQALILAVCVTDSEIGFSTGPYLRN